MKPDVTGMTYIHRLKTDYMSMYGNTQTVMHGCLVVYMKHRMQHTGQRGSLFD